jgi:hypothetical protein
MNLSISCDNMICIVAGPHELLCLHLLFYILVAILQKDSTSASARYKNHGHDS